MDLMTIGQAQKLTSPNPFALLSVRKNDGTTNVMAVSWWNYASNHPATVTVCLSSKGYSGQCIRESGAFGLNIVGEPLKEGFSQEMVDGSRLWISCRLKDTLTIGDHVLYVGEVETIMGDPSVKGLYAWEGYGLLDTVSGV